MYIRGKKKINTQYKHLTYMYVSYPTGMLEQNIKISTNKNKNCKNKECLNRSV
jgi:hypothetical protein